MTTETNEKTLNPDPLRGPDACRRAANDLSGEGLGGALVPGSRAA